MNNAVIVATRAPATGLDSILSPTALGLIAELSFELDSVIDRVLAGREHPDEDDTLVRSVEFRCALAPPRLAHYGVELVAPAEPCWLLAGAALGASTFVADLDEATPPAWDDLIAGQLHLRAAIAGELTTGVERATLDTLPVLFRPRRLEAIEENVSLGGRAVRAALVDVALFVLHNGRRLAERGLGPFVSLTGLRTRHEARLWNRILSRLEDEVGLPRKTCRTSVRIDSVSAALGVADILWELRDRMITLVCGGSELLRDVIASSIEPQGAVTPDRSVLTTDRPPLSSIANRLIAAARAHGIVALAPMYRDPPGAADPRADRNMHARVWARATRHAEQGFRGARVAHPDLIPIVRTAFDAARLQPSHPHGILEASVEPPAPTEAGVCENIATALAHSAGAAQGSARVVRPLAIEDRGSARAARAQLWQWVQRRIELGNGTVLDMSHFRKLCRREADRLGSRSLTWSLEAMCAASTFNDFEEIERRFDRRMQVESESDGRS